jgi:hypothetical protein
MSKKRPMKWLQQWPNLTQNYGGKIWAQDYKLAPLSFTYAMILLLGEIFFKNIYN